MRDLLSEYPLPIAQRSWSNLRFRNMSVEPDKPHREDHPPERMPLPVASLQSPSYAVLWLIGAGALVAMGVAIAATVMLSSADSEAKKPPPNAASSVDDQTIYIDLVPGSGDPLPLGSQSPKAPSSSAR